MRLLMREGQGPLVTLSHHNLHTLAAKLRQQGSARQLILEGVHTLSVKAAGPGDLFGCPNRGSGTVRRGTVRLRLDSSQIQALLGGEALMVGGVSVESEQDTTHYAGRPAAGAVDAATMRLMAEAA